MQWRDRAALIAVALTLGFAALAVGGVPRWAAVTTSVIALVAAGLYATSRRGSRRPAILVATLSAAAVLTALQLVPLRRLVAEDLIAAKVELVDDNSAAWRDGESGWIMASYDPPATLVELAKLIGYVSLAYAATRLAANRQARRWLGFAVIGVAALVAVVSLLHDLLGAGRLYGFIDVPHAGHAPAPLINENHLAALLALATPVAIGLAVASTGLRRSLSMLAGLTCAGAALLTGSRGGTIGLITALVVVVAALLVQRRVGTETERKASPTIVVPAAIAMTCVIVLLGVLASRDVAGELAATRLDELAEPYSKYQVWQRATALAHENPWLGVGKGAFEGAFTRVAEVGDVTYSHVENSYLQAVIDWGLPGAALMLLLLGALAREALGRWRHGPLEAGALAGLAGLAVHELADFSLEVPAVAAAAIVVAAILTPSRLHTASGQGGARIAAATAQTRALRVGAVAVGLILIALAASPLGLGMRRERAALATGTLADAHAASERHPADYLIAGQAAQRLFERRDNRAARLIRRALYLNPNHGGLHHLAATMLLRSQNPDQAIVEFEQAARWSRDLGPVVDDVLVQYRGDPARAARALPATFRDAARVQRALIVRRATAVTLAHAQRMVEEAPRDAAAQLALASAALVEKRTDLAIPAARTAHELQPGAASASALGQALAAGGDLPASLAVFQSAINANLRGNDMERGQLLLRYSDVQVRANDLEGARATLQDRLLPSTGDRRLLIEVHRRLADIEDRLGNRNQAIWEREQVRALSPN